MSDEHPSPIGPNSDPSSTPENTGSALVQSKAVVATAGKAPPTVGDTPADAAHLGAVLGDHIQAGSPTTMAFAVAAFRDAHASRELLREQLSRLGDDRDRMRENYHEEAKRAAVLETKLELTAEFRRFQTWAFGLGGIIAGAGIGSAVQAGQLTTLYGLLTVVGLVIMWIGAPLSKKERSQ